MKKISSLFVRDWDNDPSLVTREINTECQWVINGEGIPTEKFDGTACMIKNSVLYKRYDRKKYRKGVNKGQYKPAPEGWIPCQKPDEKTGHHPGWMPVDFSKPENKWHKEAWEGHLPTFGMDLRNFRERISSKMNDIGTYELIGPKINGNPYNLPTHQLWKHGIVRLCDLDQRNYDTIKSFLEISQIEGIVWHHKDGRMAKIKRIDFGLEWPVNKKR